MKNILESPKANYLLLTIVIVIGTFLMITSKNSDSAGMAMLFIPWISLIIGIFTLLGYLLVRYFSKKWAWIVTLLGVLFILIISLQYYFVIAP